MLPSLRSIRVIARVSGPAMPGTPYSSITSERVRAARKLERLSLYSRTMKPPMRGVFVS